MSSHDTRESASVRACLRVSRMNENKSTDSQGSLRLREVVGGYGRFFVIALPIQLRVRLEWFTHRWRLKAP